MMSENVMVTPLFHQRSHSMPVGHAFINNNNNNPNGVAVMEGSNSNNTNNNRSFDYKRSSPLKNDLNSSNNINPPLPTPKSLASQLPSKPSNTNLIESEQTQQESETKFFCNPKNILNLFDYNRKTSRYNCPVVFNCKMDRGFFISQSHWTCYRRNYFQVTASFIIPGHSEGTSYALQLSPDKPMQPVQQFLLRLKACTSTSSPTSTISNNNNEETILENHNMIRPVALTQMTPKRDKGPQREPPMIPIFPSDSVYGCEQACVTFERLQFRVATANNGKRRASQQYFRLIFELVAQLEEDGSQHVVSECYSSPLVVRGRSPGHYSSDTQYQQVQQQQQRNESLEKIVTKKRKLTSPTTPSPLHHHENVVNSNLCNNNNNEKDISEATNITLPPPQFMYAQPPMIIEQQSREQIPSTSSVTSTSTYHMIPIYNGTNTTTNSAFSNFHHRSQSANDSDYYSRHRQAFKYHQSTNNTTTTTMMGDGNSNGNTMFEAYDALRNWQQQVVHQRTDSAATYDSFDGGNRASTRPGTPIPYNHHGNEVFNHHHPQQQNGNWSSPTTTTHPHGPFNENSDKLNQSSRHSYQDAPELYSNNSSNNSN